MLAIVRHGQAAGNTTHRFIGWSNAPLDEVGVAQAKAVAHRLADAGIERIVASDLRRTMETATPLAEITGLEIETDARVREIHNGDWTGLLPTEIAERWPDMFAAYTGGEDVPRPAGERWADVRARLRPALGELSADGRRTAVFTHGGPVVLTAEWALSIELPGNIFRGPLAVPGNTSVTTIENGKLVGYGDVGHLGTVARLDIPYDPVR